MEWFTLEEIAKLRGLSAAYVRNLACIHKWRRTSTRPRLYNIHDVMKSLK